MSPVPKHRLQEAAERERQSLDRDEQKAAAIELLWSRAMIERAVELLDTTMFEDDPHVQAWLAKFTRGPMGL